MITGKKAVRLVKDPAIKEGFPLPDTGTCRHYKKSFRWFRYNVPHKVRIYKFILIT